MMLLTVLVTLLAAGGVLCDLNMTILHNNDIHSHFDPVSSATTTCRPPKPCYGGIGRLVHAVKTFKQSAPNPLVLYGGDIFQGHLYYTLFKWRAVTEMMNLVPYDAMALGNHEFDDGMPGLLPYLANVTHPLLCTNIDFGSYANDVTRRCLSSILRKMDGYTVGIMGYTTVTTAITSGAPEGVRFLDEVAALQAEVRRLQAKGAQVIIATGHSGYVREQEMAAQIDGIDVIVGGHSHSLLYTGTAPDGDHITGPYPTVVRQPSGRTVLVVQAYQYGKYLGVLKVTFDDEGEVAAWSGNPIVLDGPEDAEAMQRLRAYTDRVRLEEAKLIGSALVRLEGDREVCRREECNLGNLITDAMVRAVLRPTEGAWSQVSAAICQGGGIRTSILAGNISMADVRSVHPFGNTVDVVTLSGETLFAVFEHSASGVEELEGRFLQVSGLRVTYDLSRPVGSRVLKLEILCTACEIPRLQPVTKEGIYRIAAPTYLIRGGDGYSVIKNNHLNVSGIGALDVDVLRAQIMRMSPVITGVQGRIVLQKQSQNLDSKASPSSSSANAKGLSWQVSSIVAATASLLSAKASET